MFEIPFNFLLEYLKPYNCEQIILFRNIRYYNCQKKKTLKKGHKTINV